MSRTIRTRPKGQGKAPDGEDLRVSRMCRHNGPCDYCRRNRTHASVRRKPVEEGFGP